MDLEIKVAEYAEKPLLRRMLELYYYDMSALEGMDLREHGEYGYRYLDNYWNEEGRHPFIVRVEGQLAGMVLVNHYAFTKAADWSMGEFFIMKKYQGKGIGLRVARDILNRFPGVCEIRTQRNNRSAIAFWQRVCMEYSAETTREFPEGTEGYDEPLWLVG